MLQSLWHNVNRHTEMKKKSSIFLTNFHSFLTLFFFWDTSIYTKSPGLEGVLYQLGERMLDLSTSRSFLLIWINLMSITLIRTSVCNRLATLGRLYVYIEIQRELRLFCIMDCRWICHKPLVKEPHKTKRPAITSNNGGHQHIIPVLITAHHINTDFFTDMLNVT